MDEHARFSAIWQDALQRYSQTTGRSVSSLSQPSTVDELCRQIDTEGATYQHFRERRKGIYDALSSMSAPLAMVSDVAGGSVSQTFPPAGVVFGAIKYLVQAARDVSASLDAIADLLETTSDFLDRLRVYIKEEISSALGDRLRNVLIIVLDLLAVATKLVRDGHLARWKKFGRIVFLGKDDKVRDLIEQLDKLTESEHNLVSAETLIGTKQIGKTVDATHSSVSQISAQIGQLSVSSTTQEAKMDQLLSAFQKSKPQDEGSREATALQLLRDILRPSPNSQDRFDAIRRMKEQHQVTGSGDWFFSETSTKSWLSGDIPLAFVSGRPGSGKSFIAHGLVEFLRNDYVPSAQTTAYQVAYFFFQETRAESRSFHQALLDVAFQLAQTSLIYARHVVRECVSHRDVSTLGSAWRKLFLDYYMLRDGPRASTFVVLDALDEADTEERIEFFQLLLDLRSRDRSSGLSIIMFGRPHVGHEIDEELLDVPMIHVDANKNSADISRYVSAGMEKSKVLTKLSTELKDEIAQSLATNANGMFLYARLMLAELGKKSRPSAIRDALRRPPRGLAAMIRNVLETLSSNLSPEDADDLKDIITWVTCAVEPLSLARIDAILRLKTEEGDSVLDLEHKLRVQYGSLFELTREDRLTTGDLEQALLLPIVESTSDAVAGADCTDSDGQATSREFNSNPSTTTVTFSHASIADFFRSLDAGVRSQVSQGPAVCYKFDEARLRTLQTCVNLLCDPDLRAKLPSKGTFNRYVAARWISHLRETRPSADNLADSGSPELEGLATAIVKTLMLGPSCEQWFKLISPDELSVASAKQILGFPGVQNACSEVDWGCSRSAEDCPIVIFAPAIRANAKGWLQELLKPVVCASMIYGFTKVLEGTAPELVISPTMDESQILAAAEWADLEQTSMWFYRIGITLSQAGLLKQAIPYMWRAEILDHSRFKVNYCLAIICTDQGRFEDALDHFKFAIGIGLGSKKATRADLADLFTARSHCYIAMAQRHADTDPALHSALKLRAAHSIYRVMCRQGRLPGFPRYARHAFTLIRILYTIAVDLEYGRIQKWTVPSPTESPEEWTDWIPEEGQSLEVTSIWCFRKIMAALAGMHTTFNAADKDSGKPQATMLTEALMVHDGPEEIFLIGAGLAAKQTNRLDWLLERYSEAIEISSRRRLEHVRGLYLLNCVAQLYARFVGNKMRALELWEFVLERTLATSAPDLRVARCQNYALRQLTRTYVALVVADTACAKHYMERLEGYAEQFKAIHGGVAPKWASFNISNAEVALSMLYKLSGEEVRTRELLRPHIKSAMAILSDDDPENDGQGLHKIMEASRIIRDTANTIAAVRPRCEYKDGKAVLRRARKHCPPLLTGRIEASSKAPDGIYSYPPGLKLKTTPDVSMLAKSPWLCDGPCQRRFIDIDGLRAKCYYCPSTDFCMDCYKLLKNDKLLYSVCSSDHEFLEIPALKEDLVYNEGETVLGDKVISLEEWKKQISATWDIDQ